MDPILTGNGLGNGPISGRKWIGKWAHLGQEMDWEMGPFLAGNGPIFLQEMGWEMGPFWKEMDWEMDPFLAGNGLGNGPIAGRKWVGKWVHFLQEMDPFLLETGPFPTGNAPIPPDKRAHFPRETGPFLRKTRPFPQKNAPVSQKNAPISQKNAPISQGNVSAERAAAQPAPAQPTRRPHSHPRHVAFPGGFLQDMESSGFAIVSSQILHKGYYVNYNPDDFHSRISPRVCSCSCSYLSVFVFIYEESNTQPCVQIPGSGLKQRGHRAYCGLAGHLRPASGRFRGGGGKVISISSASR